jgi:diguanylate cyclase (GGDEF)-like protein
MGMLRTSLEADSAEPVRSAGPDASNRWEPLLSEEVQQRLGSFGPPELLATTRTGYEAGRLALIGAIWLFAAFSTDAGLSGPALFLLALGGAASSARILARERLATGRDASRSLSFVVEVILAISSGFTFPALTSQTGGSLALLLSNALAGGLVVLTFLESSQSPNSRKRRLVAFMLAVIVSTMVVGIQDPTLLVAEAIFALLIAAGCAVVEMALSEARSGWRRAQHEAEHDHLTGLLNRKGLEQAFVELMPAGYPAGRAGRYLCVLYIDLDGFKTVNDQYGHARADLLLRRVGRRIAKCFRSGDPVARIGGDEFVVLVCHEDVSEVTVRSQRLLESLTIPFHLDQSISVAVNASIGIAISTGRPAAFNHLLRVADEALYEAKAAGKATWRARLHEGVDRR